MSLKKYEFPVCEKCGCPNVYKAKTHLVLFFEKESDADEFVEAIQEFIPGLEGYQIG